MLSERIEGKWIEMFARTFAKCGIGAGDVVAVLAESQSRQVLVELSELALNRLGARYFTVKLPTPAVEGPIALRSTGTTVAIGDLSPVVSALAASKMVVDCTVEGLLHARERAAILEGGARIFMISNEHPEILERLVPDPSLQPRIARGVAMLGSASRMHVGSSAGTDLQIEVRGAPVRGSSGLVDQPGRVGYWPGGLCLCFPLPGTVNGRLVLAPGDVNLTFKSYVAQPITLDIEDDHVVAIYGDHLDAELLRSYLGAWQDRNAYAVSHVGWGMNPQARWDSLAMYDKGDCNGTELRAFAGNFLYSTGANEHAGRFTRSHFDFPMRNCDVRLDDVAVVRAGAVVWELFD